MSGIDVNYLAGEELKYEFQIRGLSLTGTFAQKRSELREVLRLEKETGRQPPSTTVFGVEGELCFCRGKIFALERDVRSVNMANRMSEARRFNSIISHVVQRLSRVITSSNDEAICKEDILLRCQNLLTIITQWQAGYFSASSFQETGKLSGKPRTPVQEDAVSHDLIILDDEPTLNGESQSTNQPIIDSSTEGHQQAEQVTDALNVQQTSGNVFGGLSTLTGSMDRLTMNSHGLSNRHEHPLQHPMFPESTGMEIPSQPRQNQGLNLFPQNTSTVSSRWQPSASQLYRSALQQLRGTMEEVEAAQGNGGRITEPDRLGNRLLIPDCSLDADPDCAADEVQCFPTSSDHRQDILSHGSGSVRK